MVFPIRNSKKSFKKDSFFSFNKKIHDSNASTNASKTTEKKFSLNPVNSTQPTEERNHTSLTKEEIYFFISQLETHGSALKSHPSLHNFKKYKEIMEFILKKLTSNSFSLKKTILTHKNQLTKKEFHLVKTIKVEMSSLLEMIQSEQQENLSIVKQVIKINGLIVNHLA